MKNVKLLFVISILSLFFSFHVSAYVVSNPISPEITDFIFEENNNILHDGDRLHLSFNIKNCPENDYIIVRIEPSDYEYSGTIDVNCYYSPSRGIYEGMSDELNPLLPELKYKITTFIFMKEDQFSPSYNTSILKDDTPLSFIYNNNCYYGAHDVETKFGSIQCKVCRTIVKQSKFVLKTNHVILAKQQKLVLNDLVAYKNIDDNIYFVNSSDSKIIQAINGISNPIIYALKAGDCKITIKTLSGISREIDVTVVNNQVVKLNKKTLFLNKGKKTKLIATCKSDIYSDELIWSSSKPLVASVDKNGNVIAKSSGTSIIKAKSKYRGSSICKITVIDPIKKISFSKKSIILSKGKSSSLRLKISPSKSNEPLTYSSSNKKIVIVNDKGKVTAKNKGTAIITVKTKNGKKAKCKVTVK